MKFNKTKLNDELNDITKALGKEVIIFENPVSYPVTNAQSGYDFQGGLVDPKTLQLIPEAIHFRHGKPAQTLPHFNSGDAELKNPIKMEGLFLFCGILFNNFGHFLLESLGRLWAYESFRKLNPYILFYAPWGLPEIWKQNNYLHMVMKGFDIPLKRLVFYTEIHQLGTVIIPEQKYGFGICRNPDNRFKQFIRSFQLPVNDQWRTNMMDKIYVSRSRLPFNQGRPLGETRFEKYLQSNGYHIFYPETHTILEQLNIYARAKKIIFCDGGATYCTILLPDLKAEIAIVARRRDHRWNYKELTEHFYGYHKPVLWIDEIIGQYQFGMETWDAVGEIDWIKVSLKLQEEKFVESAFSELGDAQYQDLKRGELLAYIQSIQMNPLFLDYMQKQKEQFPLLPTTLPD